MKTYVEYRDPRYGRSFMELVETRGDKVYLRNLGGGLAYPYPASGVIRTMTEEELYRKVPELRPRSKQEHSASYLNEVKKEAARHGVLNAEAANTGIYANVRVASDAWLAWYESLPLSARDVASDAYRHAYKDAKRPLESRGSWGPKENPKRNRNPKPRTLREQAILLRRLLARQDAEADRAAMRGRYSQALIDKAHATRLRLAAVNRQLGQTMADTTRMTREAGYAVNPKRPKANPFGSRIAVPVGQGLIIEGQRVNPRKKKASKRKAFQVQDLLFDKATWTVARAKAWAKRFGHKYGDVRESANFIHLRQFDPSDYQKGTLHNVYIAKNVEATVGVAKSHTDAAQQRGYNKRGPRQGSLFPRTTSAPVGDIDDVIW